MALLSGTRIAHYEVTSLIGTGGMGEVYQARDTKLYRDVALKVLPPVFAGDPERMARFEREARLLASLNHSGIAQIYGIEERALVMELVEGPTLAERIRQGPLLLEDALPVATAIAEALEYAHEKGIVHRDLKPANVKITPDGAVKLLDFGLAKALEDTPAGSDPENSPTISMQATRQGVILGTAAYMSPEQARGRSADRRADIWAFGVVLYEMLTGRRLFQGEDLTDTLASVVKDQPDLGAAPREVRKVLEACLQKDPRKRLQAIADWKLLVQEGEGAVPVQPTSATRWLPWLTVASLVALAGLAFIHFREPTPETPVTQLSAVLPEDVEGLVTGVSISPDGQRLLLLIGDVPRTRIFVRPLDSKQPTLLIGTEGARTPFWSPDSRFIGFFAGDSLKKISASGGPAEVLCENTGLAFGGTWSRNGVILFSAGVSRELRRVDATGGGECMVVGKDRPASFPVFLPDGNHFLYAMGTNTVPGVYLATFDDPVGVKVLQDFSSVVYTPPATTGGLAHLLFRRETSLMAQPFDEARLQPVGDPFTVATEQVIPGVPALLAASASEDGTLVYLAGKQPLAQLTWFGRDGTPLGTVSPKGRSERGVSLSPDGNFASGGRWLYDLARSSAESPLDAAATVWSSDSRRIMFITTGPEGPALYQKDVKSGRQQLIEKLDLSPGRVRALADWSEDERFLIFTEINPGTRADIGYVPMDSGKPGKAVTLLATSATETQGQLRPGGKWLAYLASDFRSGEVYIRSFPTGEEVYTVSVNGGFEPRWSHDGKEIFFIRSEAPRALMAASVESDGRSGLRIGTPRRLFDVKPVLTLLEANVFAYAPHPDGKRFLVNALADTGEPDINVITNWHKFVEAARTRP